MTTTQPQSATQEVVFTRFFDASPELMFKLWTDPKHLAAWWGPKHFTNPVCEWDARVGGRINVQMRGPDGVLYPMTGEYVEIVPNEKISFRCGVPYGSGKLMFEVQNTATFVSKGKGTTLTLTARVLSRTPVAEQYLKGMEAGWSTSLEKLEELAAEIAANQLPALHGDRSIIGSRVFNAPKDMVFKMWTDPKHLAKWWGPKGFTTTTQSFEFKPGGQWRYLMHGPDGTDYVNIITYVEIDAPNKLVYNHGGDKDFEPMNFQTVATFEAIGRKTKLTMHATFATAAARETVVKNFGAVEGMYQTLTRLDEELSKMTTEHPPFIIARTFNAPRSLVWKAWTEKDRMSKWFGPKGTTCTYVKFDLKPGGLAHYKMLTADGHTMWGKAVYREISPPDKLVWVTSFSDEHGGTTVHPMAPTWPKEMLTTATFTEHQGQTTVTIRWEPINATPEEHKTFDTSHAGMNGGWSGTFDQLEEYLKSA